ncbi:MAG: alpha/beta hydrolase [Oscillospiraceae bacterium]|nr:alpha/beta hydrolase [Oscillospiraceae bacterium]
MLVLYILLAVLIVCAAVFVITWVLLKITVRPGEAPNLYDPAVAGKTRWAPYSGDIHNGIDRIRRLPWEDVFINSGDGLRLRGRLLYGEGRDGVILVHGYRSSGEIDFAGIVDYYRERGFGILLVDQRAHGQSGGDMICFGVREQEDVRRWSELAASRLGGRLWVHGVSMGAATTLLAAEAGFPVPVSGLVVDSCYPSPRDVLAYQMSKQYRLPHFPFVPIGSLAGMCIAGRGFVSCSTARASANAKEPILFVCGAEDRSIPPGSVQALRRARGDRDPILEVPYARHGLCWLQDPEGYARALDDFFRAANRAQEQDAEH